MHPETSSSFQFKFDNFPFPIVLRNFRLLMHDCRCKCHNNCCSNYNCFHNNCFSFNCFNYGCFYYSCFNNSCGLTGHWYAIRTTGIKEWNLTCSMLKKENLLYPIIINMIISHVTIKNYFKYTSIFNDRLWTVLFTFNIFNLAKIHYVLFKK